MKNEESRLWRVIVPLLMAVVVGCTAQTMHIGYVGPLTGEAAPYGSMEQRAITLTVNATPQLSDAVVRYEDGNCKAEDAVTSFRQLLSTHHIEVVFGGLCSGETLAMAPLANEHEVVLFSSMSTSPNVTDAGPYVFRNAYSDASPAASTAELAMRKNDERIAIVSAQTTFTTTYATKFREQFAGEIVLDATYDGSTEFRSLATKVIDREPDAVFVNPQQSSGALFVRHLRRLGFEGRIYGNHVLTGRHVLDEYPSLDGMYFSDAADLNKSNERVRAFLSRYEERFGQEPTLPYFAAARYDSVRIIGNAIAEVGYDGPAIRRFLLNYTHHGLIGTYSFDANGDVTGIPFTDKQVRNGTVTSLE